MPPGLGQLLCALGRHLVGRCLGEERLTASRLGDKALLRLARIPCMQGDLDLAHTDRRAQRFGHCPAEVESTSLWVPPRGSQAGGRTHVLYTSFVPGGGKNPEIPWIERETGREKRCEYGRISG